MTAEHTASSKPVSSHTVNGTEDTGFPDVSAGTAAGLVLEYEAFKNKKNNVIFCFSIKLGLLFGWTACLWCLSRLADVSCPLFLSFCLFTSFLNQQLEETQLLLWVEAAARVALVEVLIVVYRTSRSWNPWLLSCIVIFCCRRVGDNQISVSRDQRERALVFISIRNNLI